VLRHVAMRASACDAPSRLDDLEQYCGLPSPSGMDEAPRRHDAFSPCRRLQHMVIDEVLAAGAGGGARVTRIDDSLCACE